MDDGDGVPTLADRIWLSTAIALSRRCPPSPTAFSVGAVLVDFGPTGPTIPTSPDGVLAPTRGDAPGWVRAEGWSRRHDPHEHAEEAALVAVRGDAHGAPPRLDATTMYSSMEPCSVRASRPRPCAELIVAAGIRRVVFAWREPALFVECHGVENLRAAGVEVVQIADLAPVAQEINAHLSPPGGWSEPGTQPGP